jgi:hypothetical protein
MSPERCRITRVGEPAQTVLLLSLQMQYDRIFLATMPG